MPWLASLIPAVIGGAEAVAGGVNKSKTKKIAAEQEKTRPQLGQDPYALAALSLTKSELANGMSAKAEKAYNDIADREFSSALSSLLKGGGDTNSIGEIYGATEPGRQRLAIVRDQFRLQQVQNEINAGKDVQARNDEMFEFNQWRPWADKTQANADAAIKSDAQMWSGFETAGNAAASYFGGKGEADRLGVGGKKGGSGTGKKNEINAGKDVQARNDEWNW